MHQVIRLHPAAPAKPAMNQACNGCGVCCASAPCPLGVIASGQTRGACSALLWADDRALYRCGLIERPADHLPPALLWAAPILARIAGRYIASGAGCDCSLDVEPDTTELA